MRTKLFRTFYAPIALLLVLLCNVEAEERPFPHVWVTYSVNKSFDEDFKDLKEHGVGVVSANAGAKDRAQFLEAARRHGMKLTFDIPEIIEQAYKIPQDRVERAVMIAGAYNGKAIDRFRFSFTPTQHEIAIENPIYDKENCYDTLGRYFPGMRDPIRAEVIVKQADFDGQQHLKIIPATTSKIDDLHWKMRFDLTGVEGDLDRVILAVYWISEGTRKYWMFGDSASAFAKSTKDTITKSVHEEIEKWSTANNGQFPSDLFCAARFGDECYHPSGHINSPDCSYPLWDYSDSAIARFRKYNPGLEYPRGKSWIDVFGRRAYAEWMFAHHQACAQLTATVKKALALEGLPNIPLFRNITRGGVFSVTNDHDGTGLDLLAREFDIIHADPYPVTAKGYRENKIPIDMCYLAGLARRHHRYLVPWLQSHTYWANRGGLTHPTPEDITRMVSEHLPFQPDAIVWLGYGKNYTFPNAREDSWAEAARRHKVFMNTEYKPIVADAAVVRPYTVRTLRDIDGNAPQDEFFTDTILFDAVIRQKWNIDPFEPLSCDGLMADELSRYPLILAELGSITKETLKPFIDSNKLCILFIEGADKFRRRPSPPKESGILRFQNTVTESPITMAPIDGTPFPVVSADIYKLDKKAEILAQIENQPCVWRCGKLIYVAVRSVKEDGALPKWLWKTVSVAQ